MEKLIIKLPESKFRLSPQDCEVICKDNSEYGWVCSMILPTCSSKIFNRMFFKTIENLKEVAPFMTICLNLQGDDFDLDKIMERFNELGFGYRISYNRYNINDGCPFNRIVDDTCLIAPKNTLIFLRADDDFVFHSTNYFNKRTPGEQYLTAIHYMLTHPNCGTISTNRIKDNQKKGLIGPMWSDYEEENVKKKYTNETFSDFQDFVWTATGIFLRNIKENKKGFDLYGRTLPKELVDKDWVYDGEDVLAPVIREGCGYYIARANFGLIEHLCMYSANKNTNKDPRKWGHDWRECEDGDWVRENLNKEPDRILYSKYIVDPEVFRENYKGKDLGDKRVCREETVNYNEVSLEQIAKEIKEIIEK